MTISVNATSRTRTYNVWTKTC